MEIEVGDYVRTKRGYIRKVIRRDMDKHILLDNSGINPNGNFSKEDATIPIWKIFSDDDIEEILQNIANKFPVSPIQTFAILCRKKCGVYLYRLYP